MLRPITLSVALATTSAFLPTPSFSPSLSLSSARQSAMHRPAISSARMTLSQDPEVWKGTETLNNELLVRIDDKWYDLSRWRKAHPAGTHWIDLYKNQDATEVMYGFHSDKGIEMVKRLPTAKEAPEGVADVSQVTRNFRKWREELVAEGWFERSVAGEAFNLLSWATWVTAGICLAQFPVLGAQFGAVFVLAVANTVAGWLAHDYVHGRGKWSDIMRPFGSFCAGMSPTWWSEKHNLHHARTNEVGKDEDIATDPALFLWAPDPKNDAPWRKWQGLFLPAPMSLLFLLWRFDSITTAIQRKNYGELTGLAVHYAVMLSFVPWATFLGALFLSGFMTAIITTVTHQTEDLFFDEEPEFVDGQFRSTRDAVCSNPFSEWLWGGMQYQLEHHLFPTMPRYKYPALVERVKAFAADNDLSFRQTPEFPLLKRNIDLYRKVATLPPQPGAKGSRPENVERKDITSIVANVAVGSKSAP